MELMVVVMLVSQQKQFGHRQNDHLRGAASHAM